MMDVVVYRVTFIIMKAIVKRQTNRRYKKRTRDILHDDARFKLRNVYAYSRWWKKVATQKFVSLCPALTC